MSFQDIKTAARRTLHTEMRRRAYYIPLGETDHEEIYVRVHSVWKALGEVKGTNYDYAEIEDRPSEAIFDRTELATLGLSDPSRGGFLSLSSEEMYWVEATQPPDGEFITATLKRLLAAERVGKVFPDG